MNPLTIFYEGTAAPSTELYRYTVPALFVINSYRIQIRTALNYDLELEIYNGTTLVDSFTVDDAVQDTGVITLSAIQFNVGDVFVLKVASTGTAQTANGFDFSFFVDITDVPDQALVTQRIQTPLFARSDSPASGAADPFYVYTFTQLTEVTKLTLTSRVTPGGTLSVQVLKNATVIGTISTTSLKGTLTGGFYFQANDVIKLRVNSAASASSLSVWIDYSNVEQETFTSWQAPIFGYYEGLPSSNSALALSYTTTRDLTLAFIQGTLLANQGWDVTLSLKVNSVVVRSAVITSGTRVSNIPSLDLLVASGSLIEVIISPQVITTNLNVALDYFIGNLNQEIIYYSDPITDIIQQARQLGIGSGKSDGMSPSDIPLYQKQIDNVLNAQLSAIYRTPLSRLQADRSFGSPWPNPIQAIAQRLVLGRILNDYYSEVEPNATGNTANSTAMAQNDLNALLRKEFLLDGQRFRPRNFGSNPYTEPLSPFGGNAGTPVSPGAPL